MRTKATPKPGRRQAVKPASSAIGTARSRTPSHAQVRRLIEAAIVKIGDAIGTLVKDQENPFAGYTYASIDQYYAKIGPLARKHGIRWMVHTENPRPHPLHGDMMLRDVRVEVVHIPTGVGIAGFARFDVTDNETATQDSGALLSYADKFFMRMLFKIPTGEGDADAGNPDRRRYSGPSHSATSYQPMPPPEADPWPRAPNRPIVPRRRAAARPAATGPLGPEPPPPDAPPDAPPEHRMSDEVPIEQAAEPETGHTVEHQKPVCPVPEPHPPAKVVQVGHSVSSGTVTNGAPNRAAPDYWDTFRRDLLARCKEAGTIALLAVIWKANETDLNRLAQHDQNAWQSLADAFAGKRLEIEARLAPNAVVRITGPASEASASSQRPALVPVSMPSGSGATVMPFPPPATKPRLHRLPRD